jgi:hypothetical protein
VLVSVKIHCTAAQREAANILKEHTASIFRAETKNPKKKHAAD